MTNLLLLSLPLILSLSTTSAYDIPYNGPQQRFGVQAHRGGMWIRPDESLWVSVVIIARTGMLSDTASNLGICIRHGS
jgi:hypothetical protein